MRSKSCSWGSSVIALIALASCGNAPDAGEPTQETRAAIQGGGVTALFPEVGMYWPNLNSNNCTATLIAPSIILTAKHCVPPTAPTISQFYTGTPSNAILRGSFAIDKNISDDTVLVELPVPVRDITPRPIWTNPDTSLLQNQICDIVGYGLHTEGSTQTWGEKRQATNQVLGFHPSAPYIRAGKLSGIADGGDSGGPLICNGNVVGNASSIAAGTSPNQTEEWYREVNEYTVSQRAARWHSEPMVSVASPAANRLDAFIRGDGGTLKQSTWNGSTWSAWTDHGGPAGTTLVGTPEVISWGSNRLDVFVRSYSTRLVATMNWQGSSWSAFSFIGNAIVSHPSVVSWGANRLDLFAIDTNGVAVHKSLSGATWSPSGTAWESLGTPPGGVLFAEMIKAVTWGPNRLDVFVQGSDWAIWHKSGDGGGSWSAWESLGGYTNAQFAAVTRGANTLDVFIQWNGGENGSVYQKSWNGTSWSPSGANWNYRTMRTITGVSAYVVNGQIHVVAQLPNDTIPAGPGTLGWMTCSATSCTAPQSLLGAIIGKPVLASSAAGRLDAFGIEFSMAPLHKSWTGAWSGGYTSLGGIASW